MTKRTIILTVAIVVVSSIGFYYYQNIRSNNQVIPESVPLRNEAQEPAGSDILTAPVTNHDVVFTDKGFVPNIVSIGLGDSVTFVNRSNGAMWVASDPHPAHSELKDFDQKKSVGPDETYKYSFKDIGTWSYHNHVNPDQTGEIIVTID